MTLDETYIYLKRVRRIESKIRYQQLKAKELESSMLPKAVIYNRDVVQTSPEDRQSLIAGMVVDIERYIERLQVERAEAIIDITNAIERLTDDNERLVLLGYYVGNMSITEVAALISYSPRRAYELQRAGVAHLSGML